MGPREFRCACTGLSINSFSSLIVLIDSLIFPTEHELFMQITKIPPREDIQITQTNTPQVRYTPAKYFRSRRSYRSYRSWRSYKPTDKQTWIKQIHRHTCADHAGRTDPIPVKIYMFYRSDIHHSVRSYRSCRSHICTDHTDQVPTQVHTREISPHTEPIPAKHDVNNCEVSRFTNPVDLQVSSYLGTHV